MKTHVRRNAEQLPVVDEPDDPYAHALPDPYALVLLARAAEAEARQRALDDDFADGWAA
jgi:hypothetical protein